MSPSASDRGLTDGPGKLCQALGIARAQNGIDLTASAELFVETGVAVADEQVEITPRIGVRGDEHRARPAVAVRVAQMR